MKISRLNLSLIIVRMPLNLMKKSRVRKNRADRKIAKIKAGLQAPGPPRLPLGRALAQANQEKLSPPNLTLPAATL